MNQEQKRIHNADNGIKIHIVSRINPTTNNHQICAFFLQQTTAAVTASVKGTINYYFRNESILICKKTKSTSNN